MNKIQQLSLENKCYIAGFLDGDGCINAQIIRKKDYKLKYQIRVSVTFFQKSTRVSFLEWLKQEIGCGSLRSKPSDGVSEYAIVGVPNVMLLLKELQPMLRVKSEQAKLVLQICEALPSIQKSHNRSEFSELCKIVDLVGALNDSKKRTVTALVVSNSEEFIDLAGELDSSTEKTIFLEETNEE